MELLQALFTLEASQTVVDILPLAEEIKNCLLFSLCFQPLFEL